MDNIAIVGMGCLYPDYVTKKDFWQRLINGEDFMSEDYFLGKKIERASLPKDRAEEFFRSVFTKEEYEELDSYGELFKWMMYIVKEALDECGYLGNAEKLKHTGIVMGSFGMPALEHVYLFEKLIKNTVEIGINDFLHRDDFVYDYDINKHLKPIGLLTDREPQNFVAKKLSFGGPILTLNAACSSPVFSIKKAIMYLQQGKADMMLAGAQCYNQMDFGISGMFDLLGILSMPGENKPFDRFSQGVIAGSGAGIFALKRLSDAIKDNDKVLGVIESVGWSSDGSSKFILAPDANGQVRSYEDAYKNDVSPNIDYIECHATGTAAGDIVEIDSITRYFRKKGYHPLLGALKGNTGHFFTASSHAAMVKVLMGMEHGIIPQTIRIKNPIDNEVILENIEWNKKGDVKRAAVNSFGFGGTNAHIVIREFVKEREIANNILVQDNEKVFISPKKSNIAVVGLGMHIGNLSSVDEYYKYLLSNKSAVVKAPKERWHEIQIEPGWIKSSGIGEIPKGAYISDFDFDFMEFKFPATGDEFFLRKDFLILNVAKEAIEDANISPSSHPNTAVIINCGHDYSELNFNATRELEESIIKSLKRTCPDLTDDDINSLINVFQKTESIRQTPTAVPGMMSNIRASRISSKWGFDGPAYAIMENENGIGRAIELAKYLIEEENIENVVIGSIEFDGEMEHIYAQTLLGKGNILKKYGVAEGAVVLVLKKLDAAKSQGNKIYSVIEDIALTNNGSDVVGALIDSLDGVINEESIGKNQIGYIEIPDSTNMEKKDVTKKLIYNRYSDYLEGGNIIESSVENTIGYGFSLNAGVAMIKNSLQLYNSIKINEKDGTYTTWSNGDKTRSALVNSFNDDGSSAHVVLSSYKNENEKFKKIKTKKLVYPIVVKNETTLRERLNSFINISIKKGMLDVYEETWNEFKTSDKSGKTLCLVAHNKETLKKEAKLALDNIDKFFNEGFKWESLNGSFYTSNPIGKEAKIAYMLPPGGMFSGKFFENLSRFPKYEKIYSDFINAEFMTKSGIKGKALEDYIMEILSAEVTIAIAKEAMGIDEDMVVAASMGEIASLFALDSIVYDGNYESILSELVNVLDFMFEKDPSKENLSDKNIKSFESYYVKGSKDELEKIINEEKNVFITIIGSPEDIVITGDGEACTRVLNKFKGFGTAIKTATIIHSPIASSVYLESKADDFANKIKYKRDLPYSIYNAFTQLPIDFNNDKFKDIFKNILTSPVNFSGSLKNSYKDGARVFIDMSTNEVCSNWLSSSIKSNDYLTLSIYSQKYNPEDNYIRILAKLISNDVKFDLDKYMDMFQFEVNNKQKLEKKLSLSINSFIQGLANDENNELRERLRQRKIQFDKDKASIESENIVPKEIVNSAAQKESQVKVVQEDKPAVKEVLRKNKNKKNYMKKYINKAYANNVNAYGYYLQSEQCILNNLVESMRDGIKFVEHSEPKEVIVQNEEIAQEVIVEKKEEPKKKDCVWDYDEIIEMTSNSMAKVLGPRYEIVDKYPVRARLPLPPFLFVTRITKINAEYGAFNKPAMIEIEYDLRDDCLFVVGKQVSHVVVTESAQIGIFLVAYMGIDEISNGTLHFRIADTKAIIHSALPQVGETFRGVYEIKTFLKQGATTLVINTYKAYVGDRLVLSIDAIGGFFTEQDLENSKGIIETPKLNSGKNVDNVVRTPIKFKPYKDSYGIDTLTQFYNLQLEGNIHGPNDGYSPIPIKARMLDRITYISDEGGKYGLGEVFAEKDIDENHWAFKVHFLNDPVLPGSLLLEGINQMNYFLLDAGIIGRRSAKSIEPCKNSSAKVLFRGQVRPIKSTIIYKINFKKFIDTKEMFSFYFDADIYWEGTHIVKGEDLSVCIES